MYLMAEESMTKQYCPVLNTYYEQLLYLLLIFKCHLNVGVLFLRSLLSFRQTDFSKTIVHYFQVNRNTAQLAQ